MAELKQNPLLKDYQNYIQQIGVERGWNKNNHLELFLLFSEEVGELAKAIRNYDKLYAEKDKSHPVNIDEELADVFNYLLDLANYFKIDLETAFRNKEQINATRKWD